MKREVLAMRYKYKSIWSLFKIPAKAVSTLTWGVVAAAGGSSPDEPSASEPVRTTRMGAGSTALALLASSDGSVPDFFFLDFFFLDEDLSAGSLVGTAELAVAELAVAEAVPVGAVKEVAWAA